MKLDLITPEQVYFSGEVNSVTLPGSKGTFTILENHAPIISSLTNGKVLLTTESSENEINISGGFVEGHGNVITVCAEII